ncbi:winged helix-turn-helix domain-containing protein [Methanococcus maripaludis]|nr:winged helix-turn-helix domain-containing protein [Methanococcus maripaludis]
MRYVAYKIHPQEFAENEIFEKSLILDGKRIHRVRLLGNVSNVDKSNIVSFELDGISVKDFENKSLDVEENDLLDVVGRIGEYNGERYVALEIYSKKNENKDKWIELRNLEIEKTRNYVKDEETITYNREEMSGELSIESEALEDLYGELDVKDKILDIIRENDGITYEDLIDNSGLEDVELDNVLSELKEDGEIYEPNPGSYRIL